MKKIGLLICLGLCSCQTYPTAQDVYYEKTTSVPYNPPAVLYNSQGTAPATYITTEPQTIYVTEQPTTQVIYVEEPAYVAPSFVSAPPLPPAPPHHFDPRTQPLPPHPRPSHPLPPHHGHFRP